MKNLSESSIKRLSAIVKCGRVRHFNGLFAWATLAIIGVVANMACVVPAFAQIIGTTQLNIERRGHTATLLDDGKVLIVGGDNQNGMISQAEIFDPASQNTSLSGASTIARTDHTATKLSDGRVMVIGGQGQNGSLTSTEIYNPITASFTSGPSLTTPRNGHTATVLADDRILVVGGDNTGSAEIYDPATQKFSLLTGSMQTARKFHSAILTSAGQVLIVGGVTPQNTILNTAEVFDPASQSFYLPPTDMQAARALPTLKLLADGKVQIIGGDAELSMEVFDPSNGIFIAKALLPPNTDLLAATLSTQSRAALFSPTVSQDPLLQGVLTPEQLALLDRADHSITELPSRNQALVAGGMNSGGQILNSAKVVNSSKASVTTDKTDYPPGEIVTISGSGFQPDEQVQLSLHEFPEQYPDIVFSAVANQNGNFLAKDFAPQLIDLDRIFTVTAVGQASGFTAQTAFKDGNPQTLTIAITQNPNPVAPGGSATYTVSLSFNGNSNNCTVGLTATPTASPAWPTPPAGGFFAFSSASVTGNGGPGGSPKTSILTVTVPGSMSANTYNFTVGITYPSGHGCQNTNSNPIVLGTLVVQVAGTTPTITSANSTTFTVGAPGSFTVTTTGSPKPALTKSGTLPASVTFVDNGDGTATLSGTPALGTVTSYPITITANNGISPDATQSFTLTVQKADQTTLTVNAPATLKYGNTATLTTTGGSGTGTVTFGAGGSTGCTVTGDQLSVTDASGICSVTAFKAADPDYKLATSAPVTVILLKAAATINVTPYDGPYTATPHGASGTATGLLGADLNTLLHVAATTYTDVPGGPVSWTFDGNTNYNSASGSVDVKISKATSTTTVTGGSFTYDGNPHSATVSVTGAGLNLTPAPSYSGGCSEAPVYVYQTTPIACTASYTYAGDANHTGSNGSATITIKTALAFNGFYSPIGGSVETSNGGTFGDPVRSFKLGSTIPVKFGATWLNGGASLTSGIHTLQVVKYSNATDSDPAIDATPTDAATTGNQFRLTDSDWHFNLSTKGLTAGTWLLKATLVDGSIHTVWVTIKK